MIMIATGDLQMPCAFCGAPCSADGRLECAHLESVTPIPEYARTERCKYIFRFRNRRNQPEEDVTA